ncbi:MAG: AsmA family protein [Bacteroidales bacterium]|nr:AsmA family protein [Bacteroidales bacterium]
MKKLIKVLAITLVVIFALIIALPFIFQGKIIRMVKAEINKSINARVDFGSASLSLIRSFPDFSLKLNKLVITGNQPFENDTLFHAEALRVILDVRSVFRGSPYEIKGVDLNTPVLSLLVLDDGSYNWDIVLPDEAIAEPDSEMLSEDPLVIDINELTLNSGRVLYNDRQMNFLMLLEGLDGSISGNLSTGLSDIHSEVTASDLIMIYEDVTYMSNVKVNYKGLFAVDMDKEYYTMRDTRLSLNDLGIDIEGGFGFVDDDITMDINFQSADKNFRSLLSLVPAIYARDFEKIKADGQFSLNGHVKGLYGDNSMPGFGLNLDVDGANFSYPDLPENVRDIYLITRIDNKTGDMDDTKIEVDRFDFTLAGNPVKSRFSLKTPVSDPEMDMTMIGKIDLASLSKVVPLGQDESLQGLLDFDASFAGKMSDIENARYNNVTANGFLVLSDLIYRSTAINLPLAIHRARMDFTPAFISLVNMDITIGKSNMETSGRIVNYLSYYLGEGYLKGNINLNSETLDLNELIAAMPEETELPADTLEAAYQIPDLPERIDFTMNARAKKIYYEAYELSNAVANITYKDQVIRFSPLVADMLAGNIEIRGVFDATDKTSGFFDMDFKITKFDIPMAYQSIGMLKLIAPVAEKASGTLSTGLKLRGRLDQDFNPKYETFLGSGNLQTSQLRIDSVEVMNQIATLLGNPDYKRMVTDGLSFAFDILKGSFFQKPFTINYGGTSTIIGGSVGFDQQINYDLVFQIPYDKFGTSANQAISSISDAAAKKGINISPGSHLNVNAKLTGSVTSPKIGLDYKSAASNIKTEIEGAVMQELEKQKEEVMKKVSEEADKILNEAQRQGDELISKAQVAADRIRSEATSAAETIISEAGIQAKRIEDEGKSRGMIAELAAKETAKRVRTEGDNSAQNVIKEADKRAADVMTEAQSQADEIMRRAREQVDTL